MPLLQLKQGVGTTEYRVGNFIARFEPGKAVEVENQDFANYLLEQGGVEVAVSSLPKVVKAKKEEAATSTATNESK